MKNKLKQKNKGFTLVETLVAISIFSMSILGILSVLATGITDTTYAKDKIVAGYLAQEGIEYIRNIRDTEMLYDGAGQQDGWNRFNTKLTTASCQTTGCYIDNSTTPNPITAIPILACTNGICPTLLYDTPTSLHSSSTGKYNYIPSSTTVNSPFIRQIKIKILNNDETEIFSTVSWQQGSGVHTITFSENLYDWVP
jgi:prepilin-type N-terminal cleavage/methylation domain-containing protein